MSILDRVGFISLSLLLIVGVPVMVAQGNAERNSECRANGGQVVVFQNKAPGCILP